jgi:hypothetical protein
MMVVGCATVAGCSSADGEAAPVVTPVRPTAVTPSPSPTPTRPTGTDDAAAIATAQAYFAAFNEGNRTRSSNSFRALSTGACVSCNKDAARLDSLSKNNWTIEGGDYHVSLASKDTVVHQEPFTRVQMTLTGEAATVRGGDGAVVARFDAPKRMVVSVRLVLRDGQWLVAGVDK